VRPLGHRVTARRVLLMSAMGVDMADNAPLTGQAPFAVGQAGVVRIPVPATGGLCIELRPREYVPPSGSTSTVFVQDATGRRHPS
jgi:hypothetical protein